MMKLLILSDSPLFTTGYANIAREFALSLPDEIETAFGSLQHMPGLLYYEADGRKFRHYGCNPPQKIEDAVTDFSPDLVMHIRDVLAQVHRWFPASYQLRPLVRDTPVWGWIPVQHLIMPWEFAETCMREYDLTLTFTRSGIAPMCNAGHVRNTIDWLMPGVSRNYSEPEGPVADVGRKGIPLVMSVGVHDSPRKMFPMLMQAYRNIMATTDLDFYLHTNQTGAYDLLAHINELGVQGHWLFPFTYFKERGMPVDELVRIYRRAGAYVATGSGEGLNMPLMEAAAMGKMLIFPDFPNNMEVTDGISAKLRRPVKTHMAPSQAMAWESLMDAADLSAALAEVPAAINDPEGGRDYYRKHSWSVTAARFVSLLKKEGFF
jgi:glycosyltransferase involved in cell wall biosynthesis